MSKSKAASTRTGKARSQQSLRVQRFVRPRPGDTWEIKLPNRPKKVKRIGKINRIWFRLKNGRGVYVHVRRIYIHWQRQPKGRYSGVTLKGLLKYGRLIQSNVDRMAQDEAQRKRVDAKWSNVDLCHSKPPKTV